MKEKIIWRRILFELYKQDPGKYVQTDNVKFNDNNHLLAKKLKIPGDILYKAISFLTSHGLAEIQHMYGADNNEYPLILTKKGFDVALDLEKHTDSTNLQFGIFLFAGITAVTGAMQFIFSEKPIIAALIYLIPIAGFSVIWILTFRK